MVNGRDGTTHTLAGSGTSEGRDGAGQYSSFNCPAALCYCAQPGHRYEGWLVVCEREGSTATGLLQGLKAVMLFLGSAAAFCGRQRSQCLTPHKARQRERARARASELVSERERERE